MPVLQNDVADLTLGDLEEVFSVEKVTKEFFTKYSALYLRLKESLDRIVTKDTKIRDDFKKKSITTTDFAKKLLGQIVFLYFLQKKGWFGVERDKNWGEGSRRFLRKLFEEKHGKNFFNDILEPLFYEALRLERSGDYYDQFNCRIPFLNGGLFDPLSDYDWWKTDILLPDSLFSNTNETKEGDIGDGILDIFDRYNFTVKEDEPLEKEVAVDPEMLGKVFENLLEVRDRKSKGIYYTPREIVHYMCQESLAGYLATELEGKVGKEDIEMLIKHGESVAENDIRVKNEGRETPDYSFKLPPGIRDHAKQIDDKLATIRVCDPAVGSGAFPVGMMNEIVRVRNVLTAHINDKEERLPYHFKRQAIQNCLYGVDIDPGAVEIAKLRLWLSLIVDEEERDNIQPLPNLDYKIIQGNSLLSVTKDILNEKKLEKLENIKRRYFDETSAGKKKEYRQQIDKLMNEITNGRKGFDFELYFSEVFHEKGGFDVVIANPPYVSYGLRGGQKMSKEEKIFLREKFPYSAEYKISLYAIFIDIGIQITRAKGGIETYIVPDSFLLGRYFSKIRGLILSSSHIINILLLPFNVFNATVGFPVVFLFQRKQNIDLDHHVISKFAKNTKYIEDGKLKCFSYPQNYFRYQKFNRFRLFFDRDVMALISKIEKGSIEIGKTVRFSSGLISKTGKNEIISKQPKNSKWRSGIISGSEVKRYATTPNGYYILFDKRKIKSGYSNVNYSDNKIFIRQTGDSLICSFDNSGLLALNNVHIGNEIDSEINLKFITALLNSRVLGFYYQTISLEKGRVMAQIDIETIANLPIKSVAIEKQRPFINLVDKILLVLKNNDCLENTTKKIEIEEYEDQIDRLVYKLYGLTAAEIKVIERGNI